MKMTYVIIIVVIIVWLGMMAVLKRQARGTTDDHSIQNAGQVKKHKVDENPYEGLRQRAFTVTPQQLGLQISKDHTEIYGIVMDWDTGQVVATVVAFKTGDASVYLSSGQAFIGGFAHEAVKKAAFDFVEKAQPYLTKAQKTTINSLPDKECVKFFLLTNNGIYSHQETVKSIENSKTDWTALFSRGNQVITEYRLITDKK
ncbi:MAG: hypothetical protein ACRENG_10765 [bacterium]